MAYGEQLSACALIIFQKQWHVDDRRLVTNQKCCIEIYGTVTFTVKRKDQIQCTAWPYGFMGYALQIEPCSMVHAVAGFGIPMELHVDPVPDRLQELAPRLACGEIMSYEDSDTLGAPQSTKSKIIPS